MSRMTYKKSGVDISKADRFIRNIKPYVQKTYRPGVLKGLGGFGALFHINLRQYKDPVLVSSTDGVGTKLKICALARRHHTIGIDLVAMSVNDLLAMGAEPLFFLDYFATSQLNVTIATEVLKGIAAGCLEAGCSLIGGETAEMPSVFQKGDYELAGFAVGIVEKEHIVDGAAIGSNHVLIGMASSGLHSNGYSLVRKILFDRLKLSIHRRVNELNGKLSDILLEPTKIYVPTILPLLKKFSIDGMVHVTGGGLTENIPRVLPKGYGAAIKKWSWDVPPIFQFLQKKARISDAEMFKTFNCGIGFILIVPQKQAQGVMRALRRSRQKAWLIGAVIPAKKGNRVVYT